MTDRSLGPNGPLIDRQSIEAARPPKVAVDPYHPIAVLEELELSNRPTDAFPNPEVAVVRAIFLAGAECSFRCTMCDLWKHTLDTDTPRGAIVRQMDVALRSPSPLASSHADSPRWVKLYNSSNFFDRRSVPREDWDAIASRVSGFDRVIVENHPKLVSPQVGEFSTRLSGRLEVAMGLETVQRRSLDLLNKQMTPDDFRLAADQLRQHDVDIRAFILLQPPGVPPQDAIEGVLESLSFAQQCGCRHASIIATRVGNGMMESLQRSGQFVAPTAGTLEKCFEQALWHGYSMVITVDLWDFAKLGGSCDVCADMRSERLSAMNLSQVILPFPTMSCGCCGA